MVTGLVPLDGGHSGETFLAEAAGERSVVRIYAGRGATRGDAAVEVDAAVLRLVRGLVPVPAVLEVRRANADLGTPALLVTSYLPGTRLDLLLPSADDATIATIGTNLGAVLARLAQVPTLRPGELRDGDLRIGPMPEACADLPTWVDGHLDAPALREWSEDERAGLREVAERGQDLLDLEDLTCLVHSDFNPKNLLVDPETLEVRGVLDWEYAHAGGPTTDLGNLLRLDRDPAFADAVLDVYRTQVPDAGDDVLDRARAADLYALVDLAARRGENPVTEQAHDLLLAIALSGDLHAVP
jgi:aminoglycoside phosphotransferase (APT) family kinase protein